MSNRWERGQSPPYTLSRLTTGGTVIASSTALESSQTGNSQLSIAGQIVPYFNSVFHQGDGEAAVSGYVTPSGQTLSRTNYAALYGRISTTWGVGDGVNTFNVPKVDGGVSLQCATAPSVPKPVGTVSSGTFPVHTHNILIAPSPAYNCPYIPNFGGPNGFDPTGNNEIYPSTRTVNPIPVSNPNPLSINANSRMIGTLSATALAVQDSNVLPIGTIIGYIGTSTNWDNTVYPWLLCDGSAYQRADYPALYALWGTTFGSSSSTNFLVPNLQGRFIYHGNQYTGQYESLSINPSTIFQNIGEMMPQHIHALSSPRSIAANDTRQKNPASTGSDGAPVLVSTVSTGPGTQSVPGNASVLWLVKAS